MPKISIIIPVYNNQYYLEQCLMSVCNQTLQDIEIIILDDGSTDSSPEICDNFADRDSRIRVIHKENTGMGDTYNIGISNATGEYIAFVESDDFVSEYMYEDLYNLTERKKVDIVKSSWFDFKNNKAEKFNNLYKVNSYEVITPPNQAWLLKLHASIWSAIYRRDFLVENKISFLPTPGASYQDASFSAKALLKAKEMILTPNAYYFYRTDNANSSINSTAKQDAIFNEYHEIDKFLDENPDIKAWANSDKLIGQYWNYKWTYMRVAQNLKSIVLKRFAQEFKNYSDRGELSQNFMLGIEPEFLNILLNLA